MAYGNREANHSRNAGSVTKADKIIETDMELMAKVNSLSAELQKNNARLEATLADLERTRQDGAHSSRQITEVYNSLHEECLAIKKEMRYLATQSENIYLEITGALTSLVSKLSGASGADFATGGVAALDYDKLKAKVKEVMPAEIDYDKLAEKVAAILPAQEFISPDYIACKVAEQIVVPEPSAPVHAESAAAVTAEGAPAPAPVSYPVSGDFNIDEEGLADRIALKVGSIKADDFDILVDEEGCGSISETLAKKLDYDAISDNVAERLRPALDAMTAIEPDYEDIALRISEKVTVAGINEEVIADKAAAALSNYLPEIDTDDIADKVASQVLSSMPAVDGEAITKTVTEKLAELQEDHDYDIVIDEEGVNRITEYVAGEVLKSTSERFDEVERQIAELKAMLGGMAVREVIREQAAPAEEAEEPAEEVAQEIFEEQPEEAEVTEEAEEAAEPAEEVAQEVFEEPAEEAEPVQEEAAEQEEEQEEQLVTVSDVVEAEEVQEESDEAMAELVEDLDERPAEGEIMPDGLLGGGVDFEHMMKYNRSFIARIIQSTDEQKQYYGQVKTALLSYAKVNSNVAWGAERFNKGRETIARFKIRGKTLCLYLALDPAEYKFSVYHHADVSDNKSMHGTPMMVKIKSPLGVKKAIRLIDEMLEKRGGIKRNKQIERDYAAMYPYESIEELIEDGLVKDVTDNS